MTANSSSFIATDVMPPSAFRFWLAAYLILLAAIIGGMFVLRSSVLAEMSTPTATAQWNRWRAEAAQQDGTTGPVQRTVPKSNEPPLLLLMRNYFPASLIGAIMPLSALYWFIAWLVCGVTRQSRQNSPTSRSNAR